MYRPIANIAQRLARPALTSFGDGVEAEDGAILEQVRKIAVKSPDGQKQVMPVPGKLRDRFKISEQVVKERPVCLCRCELGFQIEQFYHLVGAGDGSGDLILRGWQEDLSVFL